MRFHKSLVKKYGARFTVVLQYSLSEQVRNERKPFITAGHAMWFTAHVKVRYKSSATKRDRRTKKNTHKPFIVDSS